MNLSPLMVQLATAKADDAGLRVDFTVGDAAEPNLEPGGYDVVFARHVVWALPDPGVALRRWADLLARPVDWSSSKAGGTPGGAERS